MEVVKAHGVPPYYSSPNSAAARLKMRATMPCTGNQPKDEYKAGAPLI